MMRTQQYNAVCRVLGLSLLLVPSSGCDRLVLLGSECPSGDCVASDEEDLDAGQLSATEQSEDPATALPVEPGLFPEVDPSPLDAAIQFPLALRNTSFTPDGGSLINELTFIELFLRIPFVDLFVEGIPDWAACKTLTVYYNLDTFPDAGAPLNDGIFLSFVPTASVRQLLETPMRANTRYFFKMNVLSQPQDGGVLKAQVLAASAKHPCDVEPTLLGESQPLLDYVWQQVCIEVTPREDSNVIAFGASKQAALNGPGLLRLDNVVQMPSCTGSWHDAPRDASVHDAGATDAGLDGG